MVIAATSRRLAALFAFALAGSVLAVAARADTGTVMVGVNHKMRAFLVTPDGAGPYPAVLVLHTSGGLQGADTDFAQALAREGYVALVPAFMEAYGITARTRRDTFVGDAQPIYDDLAAALDMLARHDKVKGGKLGAIGFSNGGYFAMWLAATGKVQAGISYYGALSGAGSDISLGRFRAAFTAQSAPVLILHGTADGTVPVQAAQHLAEIIAAVHAPYTLQLYPGVDHRFDRTPDQPAARAAAADAWRRTLDFLAANLKAS
jgi:carboxymethylenebutenolidase